MLYPADEPRRRLQQMQCRGEDALAPCALAGREAGPRRARDGLRKRRRYRDQQERRRAPSERWPKLAEPREQRQPEDDEIPLGHERQRKQRPRRALVERLIPERPPGALVDTLASQGERLGKTPAIKAARLDSVEALRYE